MIATCGLGLFFVTDSQISADDNITALQERLQVANDATTGAAGKWEYKYTAEPYAFFYNKSTKEWKMLQVTSSTQHTINVVFNNWSQTINRWASGQYLG